MNYISDEWISTEWFSKGKVHSGFENHCYCSTEGVVFPATGEECSKTKLRKIRWISESSSLPIPDLPSSRQASKSAESDSIHSVKLHHSVSLLFYDYKATESVEWSTVVKQWTCNSKKAMTLPLFLFSFLVFVSDSNSHSFVVPLDFYSNTTF